MEYETEMKPRDLKQELGRISQLSSHDNNKSEYRDSSLCLTIDKKDTTDLCKLHHESSPMSVKLYQSGDVVDLKVQKIEA